jgi:hypothetical protein
MAVLPSVDRPTEAPWLAFPTAPVPTSFDPCWLHTPALRVKTHTAPADALSPNPPTMAVLPSPDSATELPWLAPLVPLTAPVPTSLIPCWLRTPALRVNTHTAPAPALSPAPPTMAVLPSAESATESPWLAEPLAPVPTRFEPCWVNCADTGCEAQNIALKTRADAAALAARRKQLIRDVAATAIRACAARAKSNTLIISPRTHGPARHKRPAGTALPRVSQADHKQTVYWFAMRRKGRQRSDFRYRSPIQLGQTASTAPSPTPDAPSGAPC